MSAQTSLNVVPLVWVKGEADKELVLARQCLEQFAAHPTDFERVRDARIHLHQVTGAARMLELHGVARFCQELEAVMSALEGPDLRPEPALMQLLSRDIGAVLGFLDDLQRGKPNTPLSLYPLYRETALARGQSASEVDLFFPDLSPAAPPAAETHLSPAELSMVLRGERARFQRALLGWLRNPEDQGQVGEMARAVFKIEESVDKPQDRAFWWVCSAFMEALQGDGISAELSAKHVCGKIDQQMRRLAEGQPTADERLLREVLWQVSRSQPLPGRVADVQHAYHLKALLPSPLKRALEETGRALDEPVLADMREALAGVKEAWVRCTMGTGSLESLPQLLQHAARLRQGARELGNSSLSKLISVIGGAAAEVRQRPQRLDDRLALEMATAILLVEGAIDSFHVLSPDFPQHVEAVVGRIRHAALGTWDESKAPPLPKTDDATRHAEEREIIAQLTREIEVNLKQAEEILDAFFRNPARRAELASVEPLLAQVAGVLAMVEAEAASRVLRGCRSLLRTLATATDAPADRGSMELLASALSALGFYMEAMRAEEADRDERILEPVLSLLGAVPEETLAPMAEAPAAEAAPREAPAPEELAAPAVEPELLDIFIEESGDVLDAIGAKLQACRERPEDREALVSIRRGFHTLKGSGRMVGLRDLGEVAWAIEQVMNRWLEEARPANDELIRLIESAHDRFSAWASTLREGGQPVIEADDLLSGAMALGAKSVALPARAPAAEPEVPSVPVAEAPVPEPPLPSEIVIGGVAIPQDLFLIFSREAGQHAHALRRELATRRERPDEPPRAEFMRAAHTLSGITRTVGLTDTADLAFGLEQWLKNALNGTTRIGEPELELIGRAVDLLASVVEGICEQRSPSEAEQQATIELTGSLQNALGQALEISADQMPGILAEEEPLPPLAEEVPSEGVLMRGAGEPSAEEARAAERRALRDDIDPQLLRVFLEEAGEIVPQVGAELRAWRAHPADPDAPQLLRRALHTLKGSARMAGAMRLGELAHSMETRVGMALEEGEPPAALLDDIEERFDRLMNALDVLQKPGAELAAPEEAPALEPVPVAPEAAPAGREMAMPPSWSATPLPVVPEAGRTSFLRVRADLLDRLVNEAGEVSIARSRIEAEIHSLRLALLELTENVVRLRGQLREMEIQAEGQMQSRLSELQDRHEAFDPLEFDRFTRFQELTRMMAESVNDVATVQQNLLKHIGDSEIALLQQARMSRELQQELMRVRAVPFSSYAERFYRTVRQATRDIGRKARLVITGGDVELDRGVMEKVSAPIEHMLRNAVAHGIESPEERVACGKPESGVVSISVKQEGNEISISLADDGAGLNLQDIRKKAVGLGLLAEGQNVTEAQAMQFIFAPGFSTASEVTEVYGRGVGMDVVRSEVTSLGGRVEVASTANQGTTFTLYLPLTLAVAQVVLVRAGPRTYAVPSAMVEQVRQVKPEELKALYESRQIEFRGHVYPFHYLPRIMGDAESLPEGKRFSQVALLRSGLQRVAVHVDDLTSNQEVVVKNIGPQLSRVPGIEGATVLGTGQVVLIINPAQFAQREELLELSVPPAPAKSEELVAAPPVVMIVDDSLTVRKITGRLLAREGYQVMTAKDGLDALQQIEETIPDIMLLDIEMPRMDGFDLTKHLRANPRTKHVPIIMITSRTADKHRSYAKDLGVNVYLGKPYQEDELLGHIAELLKREAPALAS